MTYSVVLLRRCRKRNSGQTPSLWLRRLLWMGP